MMNEFNKTAQGLDLTQFGNPADFLVQDLADHGAVKGLAEYGFQLHTAEPAADRAATPTPSIGTLKR